MSGATPVGMPSIERLDVALQGSLKQGVLVNGDGKNCDSGTDNCKWFPFHLLRKKSP